MNDAKFGSNFSAELQLCKLQFKQYLIWKSHNTGKESMFNAAMVLLF